MIWRAEIEPPQLPVDDRRIAARLPRNDHCEITLKQYVTTESTSNQGATAMKVFIRLILIITLGLIVRTALS